MRKLLALILIIGLVAVFTSDMTRANAQGRTYVVQPGDSLFSIAAKFNVSVSELATINRIYDVNSVSVGQVLILPNPLPAGYNPNYPTTGQVINQGQQGTGNVPTSPGPYTPPTTPYVPPTTPTGTYTTPVYTPPIVTYPPGTTITTVTTYTSYVVRPGDTLASIAQRFGTTPQAILSANAIANPNLIYVGQLLTIPRIRTTVVKPRVVFFPSPVIRGRIYIVQPGDNLFSIAARFGRDVYAIARANRLLNLNAIYIGQPLVIP